MNLRVASAIVAVLLLCIVPIQAQNDKLDTEVLIEIYDYDSYTGRYSRKQTISETAVNVSCTALVGQTVNVTVRLHNLFTEVVWVSVEWSFAEGNQIPTEYAETITEFSIPREDPRTWQFGKSFTVSLINLTSAGDIVILFAYAGKYEELGAERLFRSLEPVHRVLIGADRPVQTSLGEVVLFAAIFGVALGICIIFKIRRSGRRTPSDLDFTTQMASRLYPPKRIWGASSQSKGSTS